jgi:hypothetical protein
VTTRILHQDAERRGRLTLAACAVTLLAATAWIPVEYSLLAQSPSRQAAQPVAPAAAAAVIRGRVVRADNGDPLPGARVAVGSVCVRGRGASACASGVLPELTTAADGRFEHRDVPPGTYRLTVARSGYVTQGGSVGPALAQVEARLGTPVDVTIALSRSAVVAGRVTDDRGYDIQDARVSLMRWRWQNGKRLLSPGSPVADVTDDRGQFRLFGIPAGTYLLVAEMVNPVGPEPVTAYYPDTTSVSQAQPLTLRPGDELAGLTLSLSRAPTSSISGIVTRADGKPFGPGGDVSLMPVDGFDRGGLGASTRVNQDGSFAFSGVRPGEYVIAAGVSDAPQLRARERVTLSGADVVVPLMLHEGYAIRGRFVFESAAPAPTVRPRFDGSGAVAESDGSWPPGSVAGAADGTFEIAGLNGRYRLMPSAPAGYGVKRITLRGVDVTDTPLDASGQDVEGVEVLLTQRVTRVSGTVTGVAGRREAAAVVIFPEEQSKLWPRTRYLRMARLETRDAFSVADLPPGRYLAIAVAEHETGEESNPELLQRFRPAATPFTLEEGESRVLNLAVTVP